ncbi:MAG: hydroxymethylglutaryl-CoA synthase [Candidatus Helarchaeota archaeon]
MDNSIKILGYGSYIPMYRIKREEYIRIWGYFSGSIEEKSVIGYDEDAITMAVEAANNAIKNTGIDKEKISLIAVGTCSSPYSIKSVASEIAMALGIPLDIALLDFKESEKAGSTALSAGIDIINSKGGYGLIIGSDSISTDPGENSEHTLGAAAAALIISKSGNGIAEILNKKSSNIEFIPDRFKKEGSKNLIDLEIASYSNYAYKNSVKNAMNNLMKESNLTLEDIDHIFIQGHDLKQPSRLIDKKYKEKLYLDIIRITGDCGSATSLLGLNSIFHYRAKSNDKIILVSYASGAGSDAFYIKFNNKQQKIKGVLTIEQYINRKKYIAYEKYLKFKELIEL